MKMKWFWGENIEDNPRWVFHFAVMIGVVLVMHRRLGFEMLTTKLIKMNWQRAVEEVDHAAGDQLANFFTEIHCHFVNQNGRQPHIMNVIWKITANRFEATV